MHLQVTGADIKQESSATLCTQAAPPCISGELQEMSYKHPAVTTQFMRVMGTQSINSYLAFKVSEMKGTFTHFGSTHHNSAHHNSTHHNSTHYNSAHHNSTHHGSTY